LKVFDKGDARKNAQMDIYKKLVVCAAIAAGTLGIACAPIGAQSTATSGDRDFAVTAAEANNGEIVLAKMALQKTNEPSVRLLASRMLADHTKIGAQLSSIAASEAIKLPASGELLPQDQQTQQMLSGLNSHPFDVAYVNSQLTQHNAAISLFAKEAQNGSDPALKQFAASTLPTLQAHLKYAQQAQQQVAPQ
jgi:putative membrane protein